MCVFLKWSFQGGLEFKGGEGWQSKLSGILPKIWKGERLDKWEFESEEEEKGETRSSMGEGRWRWIGKGIHEILGSRRRF